ncbi:hypothetical protein M1L60_24245 [Actinoplanes sp. TRM 88003]|uniref:Uncharacterized protein n=1 Tax=Paractinoplanes aksuensis TaxID=2939490 RepID=A0ABT1DUJ7_9ACTN|nr:hypothetical protein [Actinoplanes aksuensis]MCO8273711.1 hypothetical protein [Actinoplanes aksuensis]
MASHRDDEEPGRLAAEDDGTRRARRTLWIAVAASLALIGVTALVVRFAGGPAEEAPARAALPEVWMPPPLTEVSGTPTTAPTTAPTPAPPRTRETMPPSKKPRTSLPPVTPSLSVTSAPVPAVVDLTAEGARDWIHWGLTDVDSVNRRLGGTGEIKDLEVSSPAGRYDNNPQSFRWSGGTPTVKAGPSPTGLYVCQPGASFSFSVVASPTVRTLRLYAGVWMAQGKLTATLAGRTVTAALENRETNGTAVFTFKFRAPLGAALRVGWNNAVQHHPTCGNVDIQAAALS